MTRNPALRRELDRLTSSLLYGVIRCDRATTEKQIEGCFGVLSKLVTGAPANLNLLHIVDEVIPLVTLLSAVLQNNVRRAATITINEVRR
jgi:hypothetical protein